MSVEDKDFMGIVKRRAFHIQQLLKDWMKLYNPQASYITALLLETFR
jgi:hypothetical protein